MKIGRLLLLIATAGYCVLSFAPEANAHRGWGRHQHGYSGGGGGDLARHRVHGYVGGQFMGMAIVHQAIPDAQIGYLGHGGGGGVYGGIRLGRFISLEANLMATVHDEQWQDHYSTVIAFESLYLMSFTADVKLHVPTRGRLEPFFQGGLGFAFIGANYPARYSNYDSVFASGLAFNVGGGLEFFAGSWISVGGRLLYRGFRFGEPTPTAGIPRYTNFVNGVSLDFFGTIHF